MYKKISTFFISIFFFLFLTTPAQAHPLDEIDGVSVYDQKQLLEISKEKIDVTINLTFYAFEKIRVWESIDTNKNQEISDEEKAVWMNKGKDASSLEINGTQYLFEVKHLEFPNYHAFFESGPSSVNLKLQSTATITPDSEILYRYVGKDKKLEAIDVQAKGVNGLKVDSVEKTSSDTVVVRISEGNESNGFVLGESTSDSLNEFLNTYVKNEHITMNAILIALATSFFLGALHALTPGHGKALVAGYLVGERGTIKHAIQLGFIITITHTASVFLLGILALVATEYIVPSTVIRFLNTISGFIIVVFGLYLFLTRIRKVRSYHEHDGVLHSHDHDHSHEHIPDTISFRSLLTLGISGGIVPCIDALAILVVAISLQKITLGLLLLVLFSLGLASTLVLSGILVVITKNKVTSKIPGIARYQIYSSIFSALLVTLLGLFLIFGIGI